MKIILFILTAGIQVCAAVPAFFMLLLGLNGYSERDSTPALLAYIIFCVIGVLGTSTGAVLVAGKLEQRKRMGKWAAGGVSLVGFSIVGIGLIVLAWIVSLFVAEIVRNAK